MSKHDVVVTLRQIEEFVAEACELGRGRTRAEFDTDLSLRRHAERIVSLIGEAANRLPAAVRERHGEVPWRNIIGLRNRLIHGYEGVDFEVIWDVITTRSSALLAALPSIIEKESAHRPQRESGI